MYYDAAQLPGRMIAIGAGKLPPGAFARAIGSGDRLDLGITAPAHGLTLMMVFYDAAQLPGA